MAALLFLLLCFLPCVMAAGDKAAMEDLLNSIATHPNGWSSSSDFCQWAGIYCDSNNQVTSINLASQSLSGTIPPSLNSLSQLTFLFLQNNHFSGPLPSFANLSRLRELNLDSNNFTSITSGAFSGLTSLRILSLSSNINLSPWVFPSELSDSVHLITFHAYNSNLQGTLPEIFHSFPSLQNLRLNYNRLNGPLPSSLNGSSIQNLWLNSQTPGLSGSLHVLSGMTQLTQVWLHDNQFSGTIPDLSSCTEIFDLQLRNNHLSGIVPPSLFDLPLLLNVSLDNNKLQGPIPDIDHNIVANVSLGNENSNSFCVNTSGTTCDSQVSVLLQVAEALGYPLTLAQAWNGNDACKNWSFVACDSSKHIIVVNFANQGFNGTISPAFANLTSLRELYLNDNHLTGSIPKTLISLTQLTKINVMNNNLSGEIPAFGFKVRVITSGNQNLGKDIPRPAAPDQSTSSGRRSNKSKLYLVLVGIGIGVGFSFLVGIIIILVFRKCCVNKGESLGGGGVGPAQSRMCSFDESQVNTLIPLDDIMRATDNFSERNVVGRGGFGVVYKGVLQLRGDTTETVVAVKRMKQTQKSIGMKEYEAEIKTLAKLRHRNLVGLLGFCNTEDEKVLVYEYMPKGHLGQHLFGWENNGYSPLNWRQRVTIALDVAKGVEYLHTLVLTRNIVHRDLKPSNILIGDDMRAKVADFGMVRIAPLGNRSFETARLAGTFGYMAPEYASTGKISPKIDVYAFGVILMTLITGKKAIYGTDKTSLVETFRRVVQTNAEEVRKAVDTSVEQDDETFESIRQVAEVARQCTNHKAADRPDMAHVVTMLSPLVERWNPSLIEEEDSNAINQILELPEAEEHEWRISMP